MRMWKRGYLRGSAEGCKKKCSRDPQRTSGTLTDAFEQNKAVPEENCLMASGHQKQL